MAASSIPRLGYALLGLIRAEPRSGYKLRMVFETTPISTYSSSPGSIYPALKALEKAGLVAQRPPTGAKRVFHLTAAGEAALRTWLHAPVDEDEVARHLDMALLRFAFLQGESDPSLVSRFLRSFEAAAGAHADALQAFLASETGRAMSLHSRLAVEHGRRAIAGSALWAAEARRQLEHERKAGGGR